MPAHKGHAKAGGRQKGTPNKSTQEIKDAAARHCLDVISKLARIVMHSRNEHAVIAAGKELLERGYGKVTLAFSGEGGGPIQVAHHGDEELIAVLNNIIGDGDTPEPRQANA